MPNTLTWLANEAGLRFLRRRRATTLVAIATLALALGANTAVFSVLRTFLLSSLAVPEADRVGLVGAMRELPGRGAVLFNDAWPNYLLLRQTQRAFADVACVLQGTAGWDAGDETRPLQFSRVTGSFFATMRVQPIVGRAFGADAEGTMPARLVVISHALWQTAFGSRPGTVGSTMRINGEPHTIVGVMPPGFAQPAPTDIWLPFAVPANPNAITGARSLSMFGRIRDDVTTTSAEREMVTFTARAIESSAKDNRDYRYEFRTLRATLLNGADRSVLLAQAGAVLLLLLAVLNLASLLIAWGFDRRQEMSVRLALGAGTRRIVRMLFLQSLVVVSAGAVAGSVLAWLAVPWVRQLDLNPQLAFFLSNVKLDVPVLAVSLIVAVVCALAAGVLPAWLTRHRDLSDAMRSGSRSATLSPAAVRWQKGVVIAQSALSVVVLATAALLAVSFQKLSQIPDGFEARGTLVARIQLPDAEYAAHEKRALFASALMDNLARESEVASAAFSTTLPVSDAPNGARFFTEQADGSLTTEAMLLHFRRTSWNYHTALGIPFLRGRAFTSHDDATAPPVAIVSRALAERLWPGENPVGKRLHRVLGTSPVPQPVEIVGVVGNVMDAGYAAPAGETVYVPYAQLSTTRLSIVVRPRTTPTAALAAVRRAIRAADPIPAASRVATLESLVAQANALPRLQATMLMVFGVVAAGLVALGCYGVMSQLVATREREFAVRLVFGAEPGSLGRTVARQVTSLTLPGIALGVTAMIALAGPLRRFVFAIEPRNVTVLGAVTVGMLAIGVLAAAPAILRAMRVDVRRTVG